MWYNGPIFPSIGSGFETSGFLYSLVKNELTHVLSRTQHIFNDRHLLPFRALEDIQAQPMSCRFTGWKRSISYFNNWKAVGLLACSCTQMDLGPCRPCTETCVNVPSRSSLQSSCATCSREVRWYPKYHKGQMPRESESQATLFPFYSVNKRQRKYRCKGGRIVPGIKPHLPMARVSRGDSKTCFVGTLTKRGEFWLKEQLWPAAQGTSAQCPSTVAWPALWSASNLGTRKQSFSSLSRDISCFPSKTFLNQQALEEWLPRLQLVCGWTMSSLLGISK